MGQPKVERRVKSQRRTVLQQLEAHERNCRLCQARIKMVGQMPVGVEVPESCLDAQILKETIARAVLRLAEIKQEEKKK